MEFMYRIKNENKKFVELLDFSRGKYNIANIFKDFVVMFAIAIKNRCYYERFDEDVYLKLISKYEKEEMKNFPRMVAELISLYMKEEDACDILGEIYEQIGASSERNSQFFTPLHISKMMAAVTLDIEKIKKEKFITINDPTCGSGVMFLSVAEYLLKNNIDYTEKIFVVGQDIDFVCACMTYIQISLYGLPGCIIWGDTLTEESRRIFYTPQYFIGNWQQKLERNNENERCA